MLSGGLPLDWLAWSPAALGAGAVGVALAVDWIWGEPPARWHPVVWMGAYLGWAGRWAAPLAAGGEGGGEAAARLARRDFWRGLLAWWVGGLLVGLLSGALAFGLSFAPEWLQALVLGCLLKPMLAWRMLRDEVQAVEMAMRESLAAGRERLGWLVSRDVAVLNASQVRESAIETLAENLNDSVVAPLFWFVVAGLPGAVVYRFANTADAMWGYRGERGGRDWTWAGKWAARADDVLSWLPARITAVLLLVWGRAAVGWDRLVVEARRTPSPNSGWPMAAMALVLGVQLSKPGVYVLNAQGRRPEAWDTAQALRVCGCVVASLAGMAALVWLVGGWLGDGMPWPGREAL